MNDIKQLVNKLFNKKLSNPSSSSLQVVGERSPSDKVHMKKLFSKLVRSIMASSLSSPSSSPKTKRLKMDHRGSGDDEALALHSPHKCPPSSIDSRDEDMEGEPGAEEEASASDTVRPPVELQLLPDIKYEYLDHTADVQIHAWGDNLQEAFEQCAMGMFAYITDIERVDNFGSERIEASGHDMLSLLFGFLDEWLFLFNAEPYFVARKISITSFDRENFKISAIGYGETFDLRKHTQGTEVKAITYSNMQYHEKEGYAEVFVIIDI